MAHTPAADEALSMASCKWSVGGYDVDRVLDVVFLNSVGVLGAGKVQGSSHILKPKFLFLLLPVQQLYYQNFLHLSPLHTFLRLLPGFIFGAICNVIVATVISRVPIIYLMGLSAFSFSLTQDMRIERSTVAGTLGSSLACLLFALNTPSAPYWAFGFPSAIMFGLGPDFVYAAGTLYVASIVELGEQSLAGGLFQTMTQVCCSQVFPPCKDT